MEWYGTETQAPVVTWKVLGMHGVRCGHYMVLHIGLAAA